VADWADKKAIEVFSRESGCVGLDDMAAALRQARMDALEEVIKVIGRRIDNDPMDPLLDEWNRALDIVILDIVALKDKSP
jgi:hypothetical protein